MLSPLTLEILRTLDSPAPWPYEVLVACLLQSPEEAPEIAIVLTGAYDKLRHSAPQVSTQCLKILLSRYNTLPLTQGLISEISPCDTLALLESLPARPWLEVDLPFIAQALSAGLRDNRPSDCSLAVINALLAHGDIFGHLADDLLKAVFAHHAFALRLLKIPNLLTLSPKLISTFSYLTRTLTSPPQKQALKMCLLLAQSSQPDEAAPGLCVLLNNCWYGAIELHSIIPALLRLWPKSSTRVQSKIRNTLFSCQGPLSHHLRRTISNVNIGDIAELLPIPLRRVCLERLFAHLRPYPLSTGISLFIWEILSNPTTPQGLINTYAPAALKFSCPPQDQLAALAQRLPNRAKTRILATAPLQTRAIIFATLAPPLHKAPASGLAR